VSDGGVLNANQPFIYGHWQSGGQAGPGIPGHCYMTVIGGTMDGFYLFGDNYGASSTLNFIGVAKEPSQSSIQPGASAPYFCSQTSGNETNTYVNFVNCTADSTYWQIGSQVDNLPAPTHFTYSYQTPQSGPVMQQQFGPNYTRQTTNFINTLFGVNLNGAWNTSPDYSMQINGFGNTWFVGTPGSDFFEFATFINSINCTYSGGFQEDDAFINCYNVTYGGLAFDNFAVNVNGGLINSGGNDVGNSGGYFNGGGTGGAVYATNYYCFLRGDGSAPIQSTTNNQWVTRYSNGYNFLGGAITGSGIVSSAIHTPVAVTVGASPFNFTNRIGSTLHYRISGTTAYSVTVDGVAVFGSLSSDVADSLSTNEWITVTYTVAPTIYTNAW
jgi:hypothetical protein